jgi:5-methyltetrahydropteroyltriglutamate--homocysteine methyltransferase
VLGVVTTKSGRAETVEGITERVRDAARIVDLDRLAVGTQCGFATSVEGNQITQDDERRKLATLAQAAEAAFGTV